MTKDSTIVTSLTASEMDRALDEHFAYEASDDIEGVLTTLTDDVDHDVVGAPSGPRRGREEAREFYEQLFSDLEQERVTTIRRYHGDNFVVDESLWLGSAVGNPLGLPGRGRPLQFRILHLLEFAHNGAIQRENVWMDTVAIAAQLSDDVPEAAKNVVADMYDRFDAGTLATFDAVDPTFEATVFGTTVLDWPGFVAFGQAFVDAFSNGRHVFDFVVTEHGTVATIGHYQGRHDGPLMGVPPTGREVDFTVMHVDRVEDGRIVEHRGIGDINAMWAQLGVTPPQAS
jgi:predicted ester cyclase